MKKILFLAMFAQILNGMHFEVKGYFWNDILNRDYYYNLLVNDKVIGSINYVINPGYCPDPTIKSFGMSDEYRKKRFDQLLIIYSIKKVVNKVKERGFKLDKVFSTDKENYFCYVDLGFKSEFTLSGSLQSLTINDEVISKFETITNEIEKNNGIK